MTAVILYWIGIGRTHLHYFTRHYWITLLPPFGCVTKPFIVIDITAPLLSCCLFDSTVRRFNTQSAMQCALPQNSVHNWFPRHQWPNQHQTITVRGWQNYGVGWGGWPTHYILYMHCPVSPGPKFLSLFFLDCSPPMLAKKSVLKIFDAGPKFLTEPILTNAGAL